MSQTLNLPVFQTELVDGGLVVNTSNIIGDKIVVIGFAATAQTSADLYINQPIRISKGDEGDFVYGTTGNGSTISRAIYEVLDGGATTVFAMNLGRWGAAIYVDDATQIASNIFLPVNPDGTYTIDRAVYYLALEKAYGLLKNFNGDIVYPADAFAFDVVGVSGVIPIPNMNSISDSTVSGSILRPTTFSYQLASNLYDMSSQNNEAIGVINVSGALAANLVAVAQYIGIEPVFNPIGGSDVGIVNFPSVLTNGTGLLGQPFMVGASGTPWDNTLPGFFETNFNPESSLLYGYPPASQGELLLDRKGNPVDIGKYISIIAEEPTFSNGSIVSDYNGYGAGVYAGLMSQLVPQSAPTNKPVPNILNLRYPKSLQQLDNLTGARYVTFRSSIQGLKVTDSPSAARATSDYNRLSTVRIVNAVMKMIRTAAEPFIGEASSDAMKNALNTAITKLLNNFVAQGALRQFSFTIQASPSDMVLGNMTIFLTLVPQFEVRKIRAVVVLQPNL
jgi:hypothetical protein